MNHARSLQRTALLALVPVFLAASLAFFPVPRWAMGVALSAAVALAFHRLRALGTAAERPLQTLSNLLTAIREGDFSFRARTPTSDDALGDVFRELNTLSELLLQQRTKALEATALLRSVMEEIDVAVFAFDEEGRLQLVNRAGEGFLGQPQLALLGRPATELGLSEALVEGGPQLLDLALPGRVGRFERRRGAFRQAGRPHQLLVLSDLTRPLREEERQAWQRLIRVLGHEINNSLAPIQSLSGSIATLLERQGQDWKEDAAQGLAIIGSRAQALGRFMESHTRLARLPEPRLVAVDAANLIHKLAALESRLPVGVDEGPALTFPGDADQLEQALINLIRNAVEAAWEGRGEVRVTWRSSSRWIEFLIDDEGPGLPDSGNLFVPFFTTKPGGSGIGLVLARQIAEGHHGSLHLTNREPKGVRATLRLPLGG
jgi:two-component system, NtrC family, nitrogen regulation sensor histidine kinase NtrY